MKEKNYKHINIVTLIIGGIVRNFLIVIFPWNQLSLTFAAESFSLFSDKFLTDTKILLYRFFSYLE